MPQNNAIIKESDIYDKTDQHAYLKMTSFMENPFAKFSQKLLITCFLMPAIKKNISQLYRVLSTSVRQQS